MSVCTGVQTRDSNGGDAVLARAVVVVDEERRVGVGGRLFAAEEALDGAQREGEHAEDARDAWRVRRVVEEHGGALTFTSEVGKGTQFTMRLPGKIHA